MRRSESKPQFRERSCCPLASKYQSMYSLTIQGYHSKRTLYVWLASYPLERSTVCKVWLSRPMKEGLICPDQFQVFYLDRSQNIKHIERIDLTHTHSLKDMGISIKLGLIVEL